MAFAYPAKGIDEDVIVGWEFGKELPDGVTISSAGTTVMAVNADSTVSDPSPENMLSGAASVSGSVVSQKLIDGLVGAKYDVKLTANLSDGQVLESREVNGDLPTITVV